MVELTAAYPSMGIRGAALEAARQLGLPGQLPTHVERLRKKYASLRDAGQLPGLEDSQIAAAEERYIREVYSSYEAGKQRLRDELAEMEQEAATLGLDLGTPDLGPLAARIEGELGHLDLIHGDLSVAPTVYIEMRLPVEEAIREYRASKSRRALLKRALELIRNIRDRRRALKLDKRSSPVSTQE